MKINKATAYQHMQALIGQIRSEAITFQKVIVHPSNLQPGDMISETGQIVTQVFDHIFDDQELVNLHDAHLVQFSQVQGLSVIRGLRIEIFRPSMP